MQMKVMYKSVWMMLPVSINVISDEESTTLNISFFSSDDDRYKKEF